MPDEAAPPAAAHRTALPLATLADAGAGAGGGAAAAMPGEAAPPAAADRTAFPLVTLAEAAAELGRPKEALRAMIRRGKLRGGRGKSGTDRGAGAPARWGR